MSDGQIHPLNESGVQPPREAQSLEGDLESVFCPKAHHVRDAHELASRVTFFHLTIDQFRSYLPLIDFPAAATHLKPVSKMGRERIEIEIEPVTRKERETARSQALSQGMDGSMSHMLCAGTQLEHGKKLGARING